MADDDIVETFSKNPKGFLSTFANQIVEHIGKTAQDHQNKVQTETLQSSIERTFDDYAKKNPDFDEMWDSGEIKRFMDENPGHNAISAHMMLTGDKRVQDVAEKAKKEAEEQTLKNINAKRGAQVLSVGAKPRVASSGSQTDPRMQDPNKFGGMTNVLVARLREREAQA
jgi:hypothetical protein